MTGSAQNALLAGARAALQRLPPEWLAHIDYYLRPGLQRGSGAPFNGQRIRQQIVRDLLAALPPLAIVETGTYRGNTTEFLAEQARVPLHTVESVPRFFHYCRLRLRRFPWVHVEPGDSRTFVQRLSQDVHFPKEHVFFYLDAHWYADLPLRDEVQLISKSWRHVVVMIDDFEVPDDPGYGFDDYGPGKRLCLDYLALPRLGMRAFFPAAGSSAESGAKRGCVVLADTAAAESIHRLPSLRAHAVA
jgi:hypothetical protein